MAKSGSVFPEFIRYVSLNVLGMTGLSCYILADTLFIARGLGAQGLAALNLAVPIYSLINGTGLMTGIGGASWYSIQKGQKANGGGDLVFTQSLLLLSVFSLIYLICGLFFSLPLARFLGAKQEVLSMTRIYLQLVLLFAPLFLLNHLLLCFVRNDGAPQLAMAAMLGSSLSNIFLDYLFIFPLNMGIAGAVLATGLAPALGLLFLLPFFWKQKNHFHLTKLSFSLQGAGKILSCGLPSLGAELSAGLLIVLFNSVFLQLKGNTGVAAYGIVANLFLVILAVFNGVAQGVQPLLSRYYGGKHFGNLRRLLLLSLGLTSVLALSLYFFLDAAAPWIAGLFNLQQDPLLQSLAEEGIHMAFLACPFAGINIILSMYFTATGRSFPAQVLAALRGFLLPIPLAALFANRWGTLGLWLVFPVTEILSLAAAWTFYRRTASVRKCTA